MKDRIVSRMRAGFAGLYLVTFEEVRAEALLQEAAAEAGRSLHAWSLTAGLVHTGTGAVTPAADPLEALNAVRDLPEGSTVVLRDFHAFLGDAAQPADPFLVRTFRECLRECRYSAKTVVVTGCRLCLPPELEKEFTVLDLGLPDTPALARIAAEVAASAGVDSDPETLHAAADAARGLTVQEAEDIMALSLVVHGRHDPGFIAREKARSVGRNGLLEIIEPAETAADIGGLEALKGWLFRRRNAFTPEALAFGLPTPRGVLILGIPGTGKSLTAKAASSILGRPVLRLDAGRLFAGIVGESEANLRRAVRTAEAIAPCILWIDEIEKGLSGSASGAAADGGTGARVLGSFLSWMQEKTAPVFVVATANDVSRLPAELLRKGRFDELFFADLPDGDEREAVWRIRIASRGRAPGDFDLGALAESSAGFTGSEIEQAVIDALFGCFDAGTPLTQGALAEAVAGTVPLATTMAEQIRALREWAAGRARPAGSARADRTGARPRRIAA
jgi:hypothetical protein